MTRRILAPLTIALGFVGVTLMGFLFSAHAAATVAPDNGSLIDLAKPVFDQVMAGHYIAATALALVLCVAMVKRYAPGKFGDFVHSDAGGALTTLFMSLGGALATATIGGATWHWNMMWTAMTVAFAAAGGYALIKKLIVGPLVTSAWYQNKAPAWMKAAMQLVLWMFDKRAPADAAENDATSAGQVAVDAKPPTGVDGTLGDPTEIK